MQIAATFGGGAPADTTCNVVVTNPDGCEDRPLPHKTVRVAAGPIAFFVDPPVVFNGITTRITIYATTITTPLPANAVMISRGAITSTTTVTLKNVVPPFGATASDTAVTIFRDTTAAAPNDHRFVQTPRVFLNPHNPVATDIAVPLQSVAFLDGNRVTGIVPKGTSAQLYDVVLGARPGSLPASITTASVPCSRRPTPTTPMASRSRATNSRSGCRASPARRSS